MEQIQQLNILPYSSHYPKNKIGKRQWLAWSSEKLLKVEEQSKALFVGDWRVRYIRVHILQIDHEFGERMRVPKSLYLQGTKLGECSHVKASYHHANKPMGKAYFPQWYNFREG